MAVWEFATVLGTPTPVPPVRKYTVGSGGVVTGQPVVMSSGAVIGKTGGTDTVPIFGVAMGTKAEGGEVEVCLALPNVCFWVPVESGDTPALGTKYGISTAMTLDDDNTTQTMVKPIALDGNRSGYRMCVVLGWA